MEIIKLSEASHQTVETLNKLLLQLDPNYKVLTKVYLDEVLNASDTIIFVAKENGLIIGTFSLVVYKIPTGIKASIEDVVVDNSMRGKGIGELLIRFAVDYASQLGIAKVDLTSGPSRTAANALYQKIGFAKRETNVYRFLTTKLKK